MNNRRQFTRLNKSLVLKYQVIYSSSPEINLQKGEGSAHSINLSEGGLLFTTQNKIPPKSFIEVQLILPNHNTPIYLKGEILRSDFTDNLYETALEFEYKLPQDSQILKQFVQSNETQ